MRRPHAERPLVYVAGPYVHPDPVINTNTTIQIADDLQAGGLVTCVVPHLTLLWHLVRPHGPDHWYDYDFAILHRCDALYRIPGASSGADAEVALAIELGIPVFTDTDALQQWAELWIADPRS